VRRGTELTDALNRVMHGLDHPTESVELGAAVAHAVVLARRFARRSQCRLEAGDGPELTVTVNALDLYRTLLGVMEWCFDRLPEEGAVTVRPEPVDGRPAVRFALEPASPLAELGEDAVGELEAIAAVLTATATTAPASVLLTFP
jgi:hypothetical protein